MPEGGFGSHGDGAGATPHSREAFISPFTFLLPFPFLPVYWFVVCAESRCMVDIRGLDGKRSLPNTIVEDVLITWC